MILTVTAFVLTIAIATFIHFVSKTKRDAVSNLPGPFCWPIFGAIQLCFILDPSNILEIGEQILQKYGKVVRIWAFHRLVVVSTDIEFNEQLLTSQEHLVKHRNYKMLRCWLGDGLLLSDGERWALRRKIIAPTFYYKLLEQFVKVFDGQTEIFVKRLMEKGSGGEAFDVYPFVCAAALDIIAETAMGTKIHAQTDQYSLYASAVKGMIKLMSWRFMKIHLSNELIFSVLHPRLKLRQIHYTRIMHEFTMRIIKERRQALIDELPKIEADQRQVSSSEGFVDEEDIALLSRKRMALLDVLLRSRFAGRDSLTDEDIRQEVETFMFAGHDTTTAALSFALHLIARHSDVQQRLYQEVIMFLGQDRTRPTTLQDLNELKYTECVIKETLRLYPPVPIIGREIEKNFAYVHSKYGKGIIPAGTEILMPLYGIMRDPERFENPDSFQPERHASGSELSSDGVRASVGGIGSSSIPFSAGPRNCIGQKFAMLELKMFVAKTIREYELLPIGENVQPELNIVMHSTTGFQLGLRRR